MTKRNELTRETFVRMFFRNKNVPFPVKSEEFIPYYRTFKGFETLEEEFTEFMNLVEQQGYSEFMFEKEQLESTLLYNIQQTEAYQEFKEIPVMKQKLPFTGIGQLLYNPENVGKMFVSIDLKEANYQFLRAVGVCEPETWKEFVSRFTDKKVFLESSHLRRVTLGKLNNKKLEALMSNKMIEFAEYLDKQGLLPYANLTTFNKDELVYAVDEMFELPDFTEQLGLYHQDFFKVTETEHGYAKEYLDGKTTTFHNVPKNKTLENMKRYYNLPLQKEDFYFLDNERKLCLREEDWLSYNQS